VSVSDSALIVDSFVVVVDVVVVVVVVVVVTAAAVEDVGRAGVLARETVMDGGTRHGI
jgi:hypothetical protein